MHTLLVQSQLPAQNQGIKGAQWGIQSEPWGVSITRNICIKSTSVKLSENKHYERPDFDQICT